MEPKQKALELCQQFGWATGLEIEYAKKCALICVDEMIGLIHYDYDTVLYLEEVKQEIESM